MNNPLPWFVTLVFASVLGIALLGGGVTGQVTAPSLVVTNGTVLSVIAATIAIGVLVVAGLQQSAR